MEKFIKIFLSTYHLILSVLAHFLHTPWEVFPVVHVRKIVLDFQYDSSSKNENTIFNVDKNKSKLEDKCYFRNYV